jgi:rhamnogalacturonan endolyase
VKLDRNGICLVDARSGAIIWGHPYKTTHIHDQGMFGDFVPEIPGMEFYSAEQDGTGRWLYSAATGELLGEQDLGGLSPRAIWWDAAPAKAYIPGRTFGGGRGRGPGRGASTSPTAAVSAPASDGRGGGGQAGRGGPGFGFGGPSSILKYGGAKVGEFEGRLISIADIVGDWREEIIVSLPGELRVYVSPIATPRRRPALMQDPLYRKDVALQAMGYFYPPQPSYHFR